MDNGSTQKVSRPTVNGWRDRYRQGGIGALEDERRSGQPAVIDEIDVVVATLACEDRPPQRLGITHWSARFLAAELGISFASVARIWRKSDIQPNRVEGFKFSADPSGIAGGGSLTAGGGAPSQENAGGCDQWLTRVKST
jgi:transposase